MAASYSAVVGYFSRKSWTEATPSLTSLTILLFRNHFLKAPKANHYQCRQHNGPYNHPCFHRFPRPFILLRNKASLQSNHHNRMVFILSYQKPYSCPRMAIQTFNTKKPAFILTVCQNGFRTKAGFWLQGYDHSPELRTIPSF